MKIGFTGTQEGMTEKQIDAISVFLLDYEVQEFHHGDCVGADNDAHIITRIQAPAAKIVVHPPLNESKRAFCRADAVLPAKPYLDRNHDIVDAVEVMFATPKEKVEQVRSGTWATIRYARKQGKPLYIVYPDGTVELP